MIIEERTYKNIGDLYGSQPDFRKAFQDDKGRDPEEYMDDYSDRPDIVDGVLSDLIRDEYSWKLSRHQDWRSKTITITKK